MSEPTVRIIRIETTYELSESIVMPKRYSKGCVEICRVVRSESKYGTSYSFRGYPLTSKGNRNGGLDWRHISVASEAMLIELVEKTL